MPKKMTPKLNLIQPAEEDLYSIHDFNANAQRIDDALGAPLGIAGLDKDGLLYPEQIPDTISDSISLESLRGVAIVNGKIPFWPEIDEPEEPDPEGPEPRSADDPLPGEVIIEAEDILEKSGETIERAQRRQDEMLQMLADTLLPKNVTFTATQIGGVSLKEDTKSIEIVFDTDVTGFGVGHVTLTNGTGNVVKGQLNQVDERTYRLDVIATLEGMISVSVDSFMNFVVTTTPVSLMVYSRYRVTWTASANGQSNVTTSTAISITFSRVVTGLTAGHITLTNGTGAATRGSLSGSGASYSLGITVTTQGNITMRIADFGDFVVSTAQQTVAVYRYSAPPPPAGVDIYNAGNENTALTGGWTQNATAGSSVTKNTSNISMRAYPNRKTPEDIYEGSATIQTANVLNLAGFTSIFATFSSLSISGTITYPWVTLVVGNRTWSRSTASASSFTLGGSISDIASSSIRISCFAGNNDSSDSSYVNVVLTRVELRPVAVNRSVAHPTLSVPPCSRWLLV